MTLSKILNHRRQIQLLILQQHQQVIHQIRRFIGQFLAVMHGRGQSRFNAFFSHFLRNTLGAAGVQLRGIRTLRVRRFTFSQKLLKLVKEQPLVASLTEAAAGSFVARWPNWVCQNQQGIVIAIRRNADYILLLT